MAKSGAAHISKNVRWIRDQFYVRVVVPEDLRPLILKPDGTARYEFRVPLGADKKLAEKRSQT